MAAPRAFAIPGRLDIIPGNLTQFTISYQCIVGDGVAPGVDFGGVFTYDATLTVAANLTAFKNAIVAAAGNIGFPGMLTSNILIFTAIN